MNYSIFKLKFTVGVHFGSGGLVKTDNVIYADGIFSALCCEAANLDSALIEKLVKEAETGNLIFSDAMPYIGDSLYIPKPLVPPKVDEEGDSIDKKMVKKLPYIPVKAIEDFFSGNMNIPEISEIFQKNFSHKRLVQKVKINGKNGDAEPFAVEVCEYSKESGLYVIVAYNDKNVFEIVEKLFKALSYVGIGGERSSGYGKFKLTIEEMDDNYKALLEKEYSEYEIISVALPRENEADVLEGAQYSVIRRSGFVTSDEFSDRPLKKRNLYLLKSGSIVKNKFKGQIIDVADSGSHSVYRYACPLFVGLR